MMSDIYVFYDTTHSRNSLLPFPLHILFVSDQRFMPVLICVSQLCYKYLMVSPLRFRLKPCEPL